MKISVRYQFFEMFLGHFYSKYGEYLHTIIYFLKGTIKAYLKMKYTYA